MLATNSYAAFDSKSPLAPLRIERRNLGPNDVLIDILYCGVCHTDLHTIRNDWGWTTYPCVPGHEIVGKVKAVGGTVKKYVAGDLVGVGCMIDSCRQCEPCKEGVEQYCERGFVGTYNGKDLQTGENTLGGYASAVVVREEFVLKIRHRESDLAAVAPLLCAGITMWSPLRHWKVGPGHKVGIVGIGGLGHMGVKLAHALGAHVVAFTTSPDKRADALKLGADEVVVSRNENEMAVHANSLAFIINTVAASHDLNVFLNLLKRDGTMALLGVPAQPHLPPAVISLIMMRRSLAGSLFGGIAETQEMLDFCAERKITSDIEMIAMREIEPAFERMLKSDVKYRFVIDMATLADV